MRFDMFGLVDGGALCIAYATKHPDRVRKLIFWGAYARGADSLSLDAALRFRSVVRSDWAMATNNMAMNIIRCKSSGEELRKASELIRGQMSQEVAAQYIESLPEIDVSRQLREVLAPALVMHARHDPTTPLTAGQALAVGLADARLVVLEEENPHFAPDQDRMADLVIEFLDGVKSAPVPPPPPVTQPQPAIDTTPGIRYATSADGTRIAYEVCGRGPGAPLIIVPSFWGWPIFPVSGTSR